MNKTAGQKSASEYLYPAINPFDQRMMDVGDGHNIYVEQCGAPDGIPVIVLHGGPGGGCSPAMRRFFDPSIYRIILFDQRGCGRSTPHAEIEHNTTWDLVADIERIRTALGITRWFVFGGSWGATLALIYAQTHPDHVAHLILRGVFLMMQRELDWFYGGGAGAFWPDQWSAFASLIPEDEQNDMIAGYNKRLFSDDPAAQVKYAQAWSKWENALASIGANGVSGVPSAEYARAFARLENHYFFNGGFLDADGKILRDMSQIAHIPTAIVQGRYDMITPPRAAHEVAGAMATCELVMVRDAGHAMSETGITRELVRIMDRLGHSRARLGV